MRRKAIWQLSKKILDETEEVLSSKKSEVFVLWTAPLENTGDIITVTRVVVPKQVAKTTSFGCYVRIKGNELSRIAFDNYDKREWNVAQIHTHPSSNVTMSSLDLKWEVVFHKGALSIIVPDYCAKGLDCFEGVNFYEKQARDWRLWQCKDISNRLRVSE